MLRRKSPVPFLLRCLVAILLMPSVLRGQQASASCPGAPVLLRVQSTRGTPLPAIEVRLGEARFTTDSLGEVRAALPPGDLRIEVRAASLGEWTRVLPVCGPEPLRVFARLDDRPAQLAQLVVTATEPPRSAEGSSVSRLGRAAIEHLQAASLADVLQLLPGQAAANPTLSGVRQSLLRQAPTAGSRDPGAGTEAERSNALGTAVVLDGVPLSNNANLQTNLTILNSGPNALPAFASTAGRGVDLRQVPADQIEQVEVVRGVPSARHGDLTAGAILVTSRTGARAPELRVRANPLALEASTVAGWGAPSTQGFSVDANVVANQDDPRSRFERFVRSTMQAAWQRERDGHMLALRLRASSAVDDNRPDPDDQRNQRASQSTDRALRVDLRGRLGARRGWWSEATASLNIAQQRSSFTELVTRDIFPVSSARRDTLAPGVYGRSEYLTRLRIDGAPRNGYLRLETRRATTGGRWRHDPVAGTEWRYDANAGDGRVFDPLEPPRQNYGVGDRPQSFASIPAVQQLAFYAEDRIRGTMAGRALDLSLGLRLDGVDPTLRTANNYATHGWHLVPRVAGQLHLTPSLSLRAASGGTTKAPTLSQLYPQPRYFDLTSFNYYPVNPAERLVLFTTRVIDPRTPGLGSARATKHEVGADWRRGGTQATLALFQERTIGAFGTTRVPVGFSIPQYRAASFPAGQQPILEPTPYRVDPFVGLYDTPRNSRRISTTGVESTVDLPEWRPARLLVAFSAGWFRTVAGDTDADIPVQQFLGGSVPPERVGVYAGGAGFESLRGITSLRLVHRAPTVGLLASLHWQTTWAEDDRPVGRIDGLPIGFVARSGELVWLRDEERTRPEYASLVRAVAPEETRWERRPPLHLFALRVTKTLPSNLQVAVFANNAFASRPLYQRQRQPGFERRNPPAFFGVEMLAALPVTRSFR